MRLLLTTLLTSAAALAQEPVEEALVGLPSASLTVPADVEPHLAFRGAIPGLRLHRSAGEADLWLREVPGAVEGGRRLIGQARAHLEDHLDHLRVDARTSRAEELRPAEGVLGLRLVVQPEHGEPVTHISLVRVLEDSLLVAVGLRAGDGGPDLVAWAAQALAGARTVEQEQHELTPFRARVPRAGWALLIHADRVWLGNRAGEIDLWRATPAEGDDPEQVSVLALARMSAEVKEAGFELGELERLRRELAGADRSWLGRSMKFWTLEGRIGVAAWAQGEHTLVLRTHRFDDARTLFDRFFAQLELGVEPRR